MDVVVDVAAAFGNVNEKVFLCNARDDEGGGGQCGDTGDIHDSVLYEGDLLGCCIDDGDRDDGITNSESHTINWI